MNMVRTKTAIPMGLLIQKYQYVHEGCHFQGAGLHKHNAFYFMNILKT